MDKTEVFVIGAPKCGTTSIADLLGKMPEYFVPHIKEPHYFCSDMPGIQRIKTLSAYNSLYRDAGSKIGVDCSVWYLYSPEASKRVHSYNPDAKIIVMFRDPIKMLPSLHNQLLFSNRENIPTFLEAWHASESRRNGNKLPKNARVSKHLEYDQIADFEAFLAPWLKLFSSNVHVIFFEDLISDQEVELRRLFSFLEHNPTPDVKKLPHVNQRRAHRWPRLSQFLMYPPFPLSVAKKKLKGLLGPASEGRMRFVYSKLAKPMQQAELDTTVANEIIERYGTYHELRKKIQLMVLNANSDREASR